MVESLESLECVVTVCVKAVLILELVVRQNLDYLGSKGSQRSLAFGARGAFVVVPNTLASCAANSSGVRS